MTERVHTLDQCLVRQECEIHRQVLPPEIPEDAKQHVIAYLRWLGDGEGSHGGLFCQNEMNEHADQLEGTGRYGDGRTSPMTVAELIEHLRKLPGEFPVYVMDQDGDWNPALPNRVTAMQFHRVGRNLIRGTSWYITVNDNDPPNGVCIY